MSEIGLRRYDEFYEDFDWQVPATFNFGTDVVDHLARTSNGPALIWENDKGQGETFTFADIARLSNRFANVLRGLGIEKGDRLLIMLPRIPQWQIALVGALKIGAVPIPCIEMLTARDIAFRIGDSGAKGVICRESQVAKFADCAEQLAARIVVGEAEGWVAYDAAMAAAREDLRPAVVGAEDPAIMYYTSGSTGHPKGVLHAARGLYAWRVSAQYWLDLTPQDRIWCTADTGWSKAGTSIIFGPWSCGACSLFYDGPFVPAERLRLLEKHRITVYCAPATELNRLVGEDIAAHDLGALRRTVSAGEAVNPIVAERWQAATGLVLSEAYGQTETLMTVLNYPSEPVKYGSMGRPSPGSTVAIVDGEGHVLPAGEEGHIAVRAPNPQMMLGYWRDPERTAASFVEGPGGRWFLTGDLGRRDADGYFWYAGRADDVISSAGYRIGPVEVENALMEHPAIQECAAVGAPDRDRGEIVKAFIVLRAGFEASDALAADIQRHAKEITAPYKYPRAIAFVEALPKTPTGKIRRRALREACK